MITTSVGVLQKNPPKFVPVLPDWKLESINKIGMGLMNKVILCFPTLFWSKVVYSIGYCAIEKGHFRWFFNGYYMAKDKPVLIAFLTASQAEKMEELSDEKVVAETLKVLRKMYKDVPDPTHTEVTRWGKDPNFCGSYAYLKVGSTTEHFTNVAKAIDGKLYWAGEHTIREYVGCVHSAYLSGNKAATQIINSLEPETE